MGAMVGELPRLELSPGGESALGISRHDARAVVPFMKATPSRCSEDSCPVESRSAVGGKWYNRYVSTMHGLWISQVRETISALRTPLRLHTLGCPTQKLQCCNMLFSLAQHKFGNPNPYNYIAVCLTATSKEPWVHHTAHTQHSH